MKKIIVLFVATLLLATPILVINPTIKYAKTLEQTKIYEVQKGDTLMKISIEYGVSELELKTSNFIQTEKLIPGERLIIPKSISKNEKDLLARLVHAEAKGEPYSGKVAVAMVVLNRVNNKDFPNTIKDVIYEERQFEPVDNGSINKPADKKSYNAVQQALALNGQGNDSLYFFNPDKTNSQWLRTKSKTTVIGNHQFAK